MSAKKTLENLSTDLILQILSRLPAKSIARCRCVSKLWASLLTICSLYFIELFLTHSKTRPRLLFTVQNTAREWSLYSCPQPQISYKSSKSSISVTAEFHISLLNNCILHISPPISGLIYLSNSIDVNRPRLCNPSTGHFFRLPRLRRAIRSFFGYDPINKQFSVLAISDILPFYGPLPLSYHILRLGSGRLSWRRLNCPLYHYPLQTHICINGVLYYIAKFPSKPYSKIASFDLNSEEFKFFYEPLLVDFDHLINFKGKLGRINTKLVHLGKNKFHVELNLWVLEDAEKREWSRRVYILPSSLWNTKFEAYCIAGVTRMGEVVLSLHCITHPFYVYFFNLENSILQKVEIKGFEGFKLRRHMVFGHVDYVEELRALNWG